MTISIEEIKDDYERFIRHETMRANCTQSEIREIIESKQEEPVSDGLEVAAEECIEELLPETALDAAAPFALEYVVELLHKAFKAGAKWQKEQTITKACDWLRSNIGNRE
jgi:hypothetical protein